MKKKALITIPTYNERPNITQMIEELFCLETDKKTAYSINILVMDDMSPDGTGQEVKRLQQKYTQLHLIQGKKNGLGAAYRRGFDHALRHIPFDVIVMMDADFSHDPADVTRLLEAINQGNDVVIGSRFVSGGMIPGNWPLMRILNTRVAHFVTRYIGGVPAESAELTGGFKAIRKEALQDIPYQQGHVSGFGFQIFLSNAFAQLDLRTVEVPICFHDRRAGSSKLRLKDITEFVLTAASLNDKTPFKTHLGYGLVAFAGVLIGFAAYYGASRFFTTGTYGSIAAALNIGILAAVSILYFRNRTSKSEVFNERDMH